MKKKLLTLVSSICLILVLTALLIPGCAKEEAPAAPSEPAAPEVLKWRMQSNAPTGIARWTMHQMFPKIVSERTNGLIEISIYPDGQIVKNLDQLSSVESGMLEVQHGSDGYFQGRLPALLIEGSAIAHETNDDAFNVFYDRGLIDISRELFATVNNYYLVPIVTGRPGGGILSIKPVHTLADVQGLKLRVWGSDYADQWGEIGAVITPVAFGEIYTGLSLGTIEAATTSWEALYGMKAHEIAPYLLQPAQMNSPSADHITINLDVWNDLPELLAQALQGAGLEYSHAFTRMSSRENLKAFMALLDEGCEISQLDPEVVAALDEARLTVWDRIANESGDAYAVKMLDIIRDYLAWKASGFK
ncbi:TRAP transporter substrate-binding protein [Chloroflexota bacterium]